MILEDLHVAHAYRDHRARHVRTCTQAARLKNQLADRLSGLKIIRTAWCKADWPRMLSFTNKSPTGIRAFEFVSFVSTSLLESSSNQFAFTEPIVRKQSAQKSTKVRMHSREYQQIQNTPLQYLFSPARAQRPGAPLLPPQSMHCRVLHGQCCKCIYSYT